MNKKIGMYAGKFLIPHLGHVYAMIQASTMVDELHVLVSHDEEYEKSVLFEGSKVEHVGYKQRVRWWSQITKDMPHVHVGHIYETNDGKYESWIAGSKQIKKVIGKPITHVFSSESAYGEYFDKLYPEAEHVIIDEDRSHYPISATKIRAEGIMSNWTMLPEEVRRSYVKKVVVVGTESCGKSELIKNLARLYSTNYVEEHGRTFYEELGSYETFEEDFHKIAYRQKYFEEQGLKNANKVLFIDTEAIVTQRFLGAYHDQFSYLLHEIANDQKYDLWILLKPDVEWVNDGTRVFGDTQNRLIGHQNLKELLDTLGIKYIEIGGNYHERLNASMLCVDFLLR